VRTIARIATAAAAALLLCAPAHAAPLDQSGWQVARTAQTGDQIGLSCVSATWCMSVGPSGAQVWDGSAWSAAGALGGPINIRGLSCWSTHGCVVVGYTSKPLALRWNGTAWHKLHPPTSQSGDTAFGDVSCPAVKTCVLVGDLANHALLWHNGMWTSERIPRPSGSLWDHLYAVDCPTVHSCHALGELGYRHPPTTPRGTLLTWNGQTWRTRVVTGLGLSDISCQTVSACVAVGASGTRLIGYAWDGSTWSKSVIPDSPNKNDNATQEPSGFEDLRSVSCWSATGCQAVGVTNTAPFHRLWNGTTWSSLANPGTTDDFGDSQQASYFVNGIACHGASFCVTAGDVTYGSAVGQTYMERYRP
jgi:hypothetical protein